MISPPVGGGVAFSSAADGDQRFDLEARDWLCSRLDISPHWATVSQVHGDVVHRAVSSGDLGPGDAIWTTEPALPVAVFTADCLSIVLQSHRAVGVAHAGWRGAHSGVVTSLFEAMTSNGHEPDRAFIGPGIGPCCFEVGPEVADKFPGDTAKTTWGTTSVDLVGHVRRQVGAAKIWTADSCTRHNDDWFSHRRDGTKARTAAIAWI